MRTRQDDEQLIVLEDVNLFDILQGEDLHRLPVLLHEVGKVYAIVGTVDSSPPLV